MSKLKSIWINYTVNTTMKVITSSKIYSSKYENGSYLLLYGERKRETRI